MRQHLALTIFAVVALGVAVGQSPDKYILAIRNGSTEEFLKIGRTGKKEYIDRIKQLLKTEKLSDEQILAARMALARLGDEPSFGMITADLRPFNASTILARLMYVRGKQSLSLLRTMLDQTEFQQSDQRGDGDMMYVPLANSAVRTLWEIIGYPPVSFGEVAFAMNGISVRDVAAKWKKWLARQDQTPSEYLARLRGGGGDEEALLDIGRKDSDQDEYSSIIRSALAKQRLTTTGIIYAHMALARLGDESAFRWLIRDVRKLSAEEQYNVLDRLRYVPRNWVLPYLRSLLYETDLKDNQRGDSRNKPEEYGIGWPLAFRAAMILQRMVYPPPVILSDFIDSKDNFEALLGKWKERVDYLIKRDQDN